LAPTKENIALINEWFSKNKWKAHPFQKKAWKYHLEGYSGIVNAPTGSGKTFSVMLPIFAPYIKSKETPEGLQLIWISPIRALAKEIFLSAEKAIAAYGLDWKVGIRTGDTTTAERQKQVKKPPQIIITTPESLHIILSSKKSKKIFDTCQLVVVDEWHELIGSKRGVQTELFLSYMRGKHPTMKTWGISATIGNLEEAMDVLLGPEHGDKRILIKANIKKKIVVKTIMPDEIERYPWSGHLGILLLDKVIPIIQSATSTLIFTNTRAQCEIWYQKLLEFDPSLAGIMAMHHGSISREMRSWVEQALYDGKLKAVVCTSSLDLGVDFRPVENIVQVGSPKGVARFVQRAGRSGHSPGATSKIFFLPTNSLELIESAALRQAIKEQRIEDRTPFVRSWDVLIQYMMTRAVGGGFKEKELYDELIKTFCYSSMSKEEWSLLLNYILYGSQSLKAYDEYHKIGKTKDGTYLVNNRGVAQRHRLSIGTIVSDAMLQVKFVRGKKIGTVEEWFIAQFSPGDNFWFGGMSLEFVRIKDNFLEVKKSRKKKGRIPSYMGGRLSFTSQMSHVLKEKIFEYSKNEIKDPEMKKLIPLFDMQELRSRMPREDEVLVEYFNSSEGFHLLMYPLEGRNVHEGMAALLGQRLSRILPISFSLAYNDFGLELLSDKQIDVDTILTKELFDPKNLEQDIQASINSVEIAQRKFRDIACISGLIFTGYPGKEKRQKHLSSNSRLIFDVFREYEPDNLLYLQTYEEVMAVELQEARIYEALERIREKKIVITKPEKYTPFSFPIMVDRLREKMSSETLLDRIEKMKVELVK